MAHGGLISPDSVALIGAILRASCELAMRSRGEPGQLAENDHATLACASRKRPTSRVRYARIHFVTGKDAKREGAPQADGGAHGASR